MSDPPVRGSEDVGPRDRFRTRRLPYFGLGKGRAGARTLIWV